ncbi:MAG: allantoate amidohydrolase [marine actinobacterium MedAcidi-G3]|nr:MAG: allantoate amidohydrolase [marine actinobacterium MedAcidi-G3]MBA4813521.1 Zn-dependent hydrolase [Acidimicrobiales bacterium]OUW85951.1 MAG: Zn-dependent hydrolase [Acidimicrobiaceae bacterium TMED224]HCJ85157.1 Zn-dependent hydrolase [Acidimicrobiaceae bacterium]|tara:strand:+ start:8553 stop:9806 length:1254 start_codon:yes stop_codon:yes gene_type:complete
MALLNGPSVPINGERLLQRITELAEIGKIEGTNGCSRLAFSDADREGRDLVVTWMRDLGLTVTIDAVGNVIASTHVEGASGAVMAGSHIDTVGTGGRYDGNLGVLAGLEVIEAAIAMGVELKRPLAIAFFSNEEGSRYPPDMMGSLAYAGGMSVEAVLEVEGKDGTVVGEELERIGYRGTAPCPGVVPHAFVELHIEQGPVLDNEDIQIGIVEGVQGISWTELVLVGQSNHAGTTPMSLRKDPMRVAAEVVTAVRSIATEMGGTQVATVGSLHLHPNLVNVVPASATMTVDLRNTDEALLQQAEEELHNCVAVFAKDEGLKVETRSLARFEPVEFDSRVVEQIEELAQQTGLSTKRMPSGAGHDAQMMARICPTGMIFVPSLDGISHNPAEHTDERDLIAGTQLLSDTMLALTEVDW